MMNQEPDIHTPPETLARKLAEVEDRYQALVQATGHITWTATPTGQLKGSTTWRAYTGQTAEEVGDGGVLQAVHPANRADVQRTWRHAVATATPFECECRLRRFDGVYRTFLMRGVPVRDPGGEVREWVGFCADITERKQAEDAVRQAARDVQARARDLEVTFDALTNPVVVCDREGRIVQANAAFRALLAGDGAPGAAALRLDERGWIPDARDVTGRPLAPHERPVARLLQGDDLTGPRAMDILFRAPDGSERQASVGGTAIRDAAGQIVRVVAVYSDVTEERRLQRRTHEALDALLAMAGALVNREPAATLVREDMPAAAPSVVGQRLVELTRNVLGCRRVSIELLDRQTATPYPLAVVGLTPEQERRWWRDERSPIEEPDPALVARLQAGEVVVIDMTEPPFNTYPNVYAIKTLLVAPMRVADRVVGTLALDYGGVAHDYTDEDRALAGAVATLAALVLERERLLQEREEARSSALALREANRRMDEFLRLASHELRSPLTGIKGAIQLAQRRLGALAGDEHVASGVASKLDALNTLLHRTDMQVDRINRLVSDLLDVSRIDTGHLDLHPEPADLAAIVREVVDAHREAYASRTITLEMLSGALPVHADGDRVAQVITNYLTNALKYSATDRPVRVSAGRDDTAAWVRVRDEGPGLTPAQRAGIWDRYRRVPGVEVQDSSTGSGGGLGLGLHISRTLIERQGGHVGVESTPGAGSTFYFSLPLEQGSAR